MNSPKDLAAAELPMPGTFTISLTHTECRPGGARRFPDQQSKAPLPGCVLQMWDGMSPCPLSRAWDPCSGAARKLSPNTQEGMKEQRHSVSFQLCHWLFEDVKLPVRNAAEQGSLRHSRRECSHLPCAPGMCGYPWHFLFMASHCL